MDSLAEFHADHDREPDDVATAAADLGISTAGIVSVATWPNGLVYVELDGLHRIMERKALTLRNERGAQWVGDGTVDDRDEFTLTIRGRRLEGRWVTKVRGTTYTVTADADMSADAFTHIVVRG
jgi:hypothetical protein